MCRLGKHRSVIREIFEYSKKRGAEIGPENVFDFSLGNPNVPAPSSVKETIRQLLEERGVTVAAHIGQIGGVYDEAPDFAAVDRETLKALLARPFPVFREDAGVAMRQEIERARMDADSVGGLVRCFAVGLPAGVGEPMFEGVENRLAGALFGIPAVRGVSFGDGFAAAGMRGSEHNDPFVTDGTTVSTRTNHAGGVLGGITTGMPLVVNVAFKPTASIPREQDTVDLKTMENTRLTIHGRHDPCIVSRAVPVVEAVTALTLLDMMLEEERQWN